jgi:hypothetical protein
MVVPFPLLNRIPNILIVLVDNFSSLIIDFLPKLETNNYMNSTTFVVTDRSNNVIEPPKVLIATLFIANFYGFLVVTI